MAEYILLMHDDAVIDGSGERDTYLQMLQRRGVFEGRSAIGGGVCVRKACAVQTITAHLSGYLRVTAGSLDEPGSF